MARVFSVNTVFRMSDLSLFCKFFTQIGAEHIDDVPWDALSQREIKPLINLYMEMSPELQAVAEVALRNIHAIGCEKGMESLAEAAQNSSAEWDVLFHSELSVYNKSLIIWLFHRKIILMPHCNIWRWIPKRGGRSGLGYRK